MLASRVLSKDGIAEEVKRSEVRYRGQLAAYYVYPRCGNPATLMHTPLKWRYVQPSKWHPMGEKNERNGKRAAAKNGDEGWV